MPQSIRDVMTTEVIQLTADSTARDAARAMREHGIGDVVVERDGRACGIVTDRDLVVRCLADGEEGLKRQLGEICSPDIVALEPGSGLDDAMRLMRSNAIRRILVLEDGRAVGIVSLGDLAVARDRESLLGSLSAAPASR